MRRCRTTTSFWRRPTGTASRPSPRSPDDPGETGIVILPDIRGLYRFYEELALRFAERGHRAIAIDYFGRTAGVDKRGDDFEFRPHVEATTAAGIQADVAAAVARLREQGASRIFTVGFCFGGRQSWLAAASGHGLAGAIGFYGRPGLGQDGTPGPTQRASEIEAPDPGADGRRRRGDPGRGRARVRARRWPRQASKHEIEIYDGAPHSFFDRKFEQFADASDDAWGRVLAFVAQHSGSTR